LRPRVFVGLSGDLFFEDHVIGVMAGNEVTRIRSLVLRTGKDLRFSVEIVPELV
jgi:hypothetical protein